MSQYVSRHLKTEYVVYIAQFLLACNVNQKNISQYTVVANKMEVTEVILKECVLQTASLRQLP